MYLLFLGLMVSCSFQQQVSNCFCCMFLLGLFWLNAFDLPINYFVQYYWSGESKHTHTHSSEIKIAQSESVCLQTINISSNLLFCVDWSGRTSNFHYNDSFTCAGSIVLSIRVHKTSKCCLLSDPWLMYYPTCPLQLVSNNRCDVPQTVPHVTPCTSCAASPAVQCPRGHRKTTTDFGVANCR